MSAREAAPVRYRISHLTRYDYGRPVTQGRHVLHLTPRTLPWQRLLAHTIDCEPAAAERSAGEDAFGNPVVTLSVFQQHTGLAVQAHSLVEVGARPVPGAALPWEAARDALLFRAGWRPEASQRDAVRVLFESRHVRVKRELAEWAAPCFAPGRPLLDAVQALSDRIHGEFSFDPDATHVATPVMTVLRERRGVCQDFAHLMLSALRSLGLAARYMSGYLLTTPPPGSPRLIGADASHAWVAVWCPVSGWVEFDPTNGIRAGTGHIVLGWGRDFGDVTPLRGVIVGGGEHVPEISVTVLPEAEAEAEAESAAAAEPASVRSAAPATQADALAHGTRG